METLGEIITRLNDFFDKWMVLPALAALLAVDILLFIRWMRSYTRRRIALGEQPGARLRRRVLGRTVYLVSLIVMVEIILGIVFRIAKFSLLRWLLIYLVVVGVVYLVTRKQSGLRGVYTAILHLTILFVGWLVSKWLGMLFVSMPIFLALYYWIYRLSLAIVPASNPESAQERQRRFTALIYYLWGIQFPVWVVKDGAGREIEQRIRGDFFKEFGQPGILILKSHQAAGISTGLSFSRVEGPGIVYTGPYERPQEVFDLRTQIRVSTIQAISKDGIEFKAFLLVVFRIDREEWSKEEHRRLRAVNLLLREGRCLDRTLGSYHFSRARVRAALAVQGVTTSSNSAATDVKWDHWAVRQVEDIARQQLSEHALDELWRPLNDDRDANALNKIADEIKSRAAPLLRQHGIQLFASKVVNFEFEDEKTKDVVRQQVLNWQSLRDQEIQRQRTEAKTEATRIRQNAISYARKNLISYITEGLEQAGQLHKDIPKKHLIAMRFLSALEEWMRQNPEAASTSSMRMLRYRIRKYMMRPIA